MLVILLYHFLEKFNIVIQDFLIFKNFSVGRNGDYLPGDKFSAHLQRFFCGVFNSAATGDFHSHNTQTFYVVAFDDFGEFRGVVGIVQLGAADESDVVSHKVPVEVAVGKGGAVCGDEEICAFKIRSVYGYQLNLAGPLHKFALNGGSNRSGVFSLKGSGVSARTTAGQGL